MGQGNNTIRVQGVGGGSCRQDRICVSSNSNARIGVQEEAHVAAEGSGELNISPNPTNGDFHARFFLEKDKKANLRVIDMNGRIMHQQNLIGKGNHDETIQMSNNVAGSFVVQVLRENGQEVKKVIVVR